MINNQKRFIRQIIGDQFKTWTNENIIIKSGTNTGKTSFILNVLIPWAADKNKTVLYLVNRKRLFNQIAQRTNDYSNVELMTYQGLQSLLQQDIPAGYYDYIVADECHYFLSDGIFNEYTDYSYQWLIRQSGSVLIWISATANEIFQDVKAHKTAIEYDIANDYENVDSVFFYKKEQIYSIIDDILANTDDKVLVFVNSIQRMEELHCVYGDEASYLCSQYNRKSTNMDYIDYDCVQDNSFQTRILFTTKAMDNGIDIIDRNIKHVFCEIIDIESTLQSIGRKRPIDQNDRYNLYFMIHSNRALAQYKRKAEDQLNPVKIYDDDKSIFATTYSHNKELLRYNRIFYGDIDAYSDQGLGTIQINRIMQRKIENDLDVYNRMLREGYIQTMCSFLPKNLQKRVRKLKIEDDQKDIFLVYLQSIENKKLFKPEQAELKDKFKKLLGLRDRTMGINTLNGKLKDCGYKYEIVSERENKRSSPNCKKRYWIIKQI